MMNLASNFSTPHALRLADGSDAEPQSTTNAALSYGMLNWACVAERSIPRVCWNALTRSLKTLLSLMIVLYAFTQTAGYGSANPAQSEFVITVRALSTTKHQSFFG